MRQALAAVLRVAGNADPAALDEGLVRLLEALRRRDAAVLAAGAALDVADPVERLHDLFDELRALGQDVPRPRRAAPRRNPARSRSGRSRRRRSEGKRCRSPALCKSAFCSSDILKALGARPRSRARPEDSSYMNYLRRALQAPSTPFAGALRGADTGRRQETRSQGLNDVRVPDASRRLGSNRPPAGRRSNSATRPARSVPRSLRNARRLRDAECGNRRRETRLLPRPLPRAVARTCSWADMSFGSLVYATERPTRESAFPIDPGD